MVQKFCPKCGAKCQENEKFCHKCGCNLKEQQFSGETNYQAQHSNSKMKMKQPMSKKKKIGLIGLGIIVVIIITFFAWGNHYYSATNQIDRMIQLLSNPNKDASEVVETSDPNLKVTSKNIKPLQKYFSDNKDELDTLVKKLRNGSDFHGISLRQSGHYLCFFKKYKLDVPAAYDTVETNHADSEIYVDGKQVGKVSESDDEYSKNVGPYFPGVHTFQVKAKINNRNLQTDEVNSDIWGKDNKEQMPIDTATFKIEGIPDAIVLFNGKNVGKLDNSGNIEFKEYPITKDLELQLQIKVHGKILKSEKMNIFDQIDSGEKTLSPQFEGVISQSDAQSLLSSAFSQYAATSGETAELYKDQESNSDFKEVQKMLEGFDKNDKNISYTVDVTVKNVLPDGDGKSNVVYDIKYIFDRDDDSKLIQVMEYSDCIVEKNPDYEKNNKGQPYMIDSIGTGKMIKEDKITSDDSDE